MALQKPARDASDLGYLVAPHTWTAAGMRGVLMGSLILTFVTGVGL